MKYTVVVLSALVLVLGFAVVARAQDAAAPAGVQRWEYKMVGSDGDSGADLANAAGKEGWECFAMSDAFWVMKRPLK